MESTRRIATRCNREIDMAKLHELDEAGRKRRAVMSVAAALCVLGLASFVVLHDSAPTSIATNRVSFVVSDSLADGNVGGLTTPTAVPSAESVFGHARYALPEEPIAQF
jgi:hypothetical protein